MKELLQLYWPTLVAAAFASAALASAGALLVTRRSGVQVLPVSQAAGLGISLGLLVGQPESASHFHHMAFPFFTGLLVAAIGYAATERAVRGLHSKTVAYLAAFALFWSFTQLVGGFFPAVESHRVALFFGDLVTLPRTATLFFTLLAAGSIAYLTLTWRQQARAAFRHSILEEPHWDSADYGFYSTCLLLLCCSVQLLGTLFTLSALFLPTALYSFSPASGAGRHLRRCAGSAFLATGLGFFLSLLETRLLTTPLVAVFLGLFPLLHLGANRLLFRCKYIATEL